ncbi:MAG: hypothetical protein ACE5LS_05615 [Thermoplasmata archaeon]
MEEKALQLLQMIASPSRFRILNLLEKGVDHPEDLAGRLALRRQSVDKQLLELYGWGFVDRSAVFPADGRPRIVYRLSSLGFAFIEKASAISLEYWDEMLADYRRSLGILEDELAAGELDEAAYRKRRRSLETRYDNFLRRELEG